MQSRGMIRPRFAWCLGAAVLAVASPSVGRPVEDAPASPPPPPPDNGGALSYMRGAEEPGRSIALEIAARTFVPAAGGQVLATPATRKLARELGVDLSTVAGTGPRGRVTKDDVHARAAADPTNFAAEIRLLVAHHVIGAGGTHESPLLLARAGTDDRRPGALRRMAIARRALAG